MYRAWMLVLLVAGVATSAALASSPEVQFVSCRTATTPARVGPVRVDVGQQCTVRVRGVPAGRTPVRAELRYVARLRGPDGRVTTQPLPGVDVWDPGARRDAYRLQVQRDPLTLLVPEYLLPVPGRSYVSVVATGTVTFSSGAPLQVKVTLPVARTP